MKAKITFIVTPGDDDRHALRNALREKTTRIVLHRRRDGRRRWSLGGAFRGRLLRSIDLFLQASRVILLTKHFYVAAERENADAVFGLAPLEFADFEPAEVEAEIEFFAFHAAGLGDEGSGQAHARR